LKSLLALSLALSAPACQDRALKAEKPAAVVRDVRLARVEQSSLARTIQVSGTLAADEQVKVSVKVPGRLASLNIDLASVVKEGTPIASAARSSAWRGSSSQTPRYARRSAVSFNSGWRTRGSSWPVPSSAIVSFAGIENVLAVEAGKAVEKRVKTGKRSGDRTEIVSGVNVGDSVVVKPGSLQQVPPPKTSNPKSPSSSKTRSIARACRACFARLPRDTPPPVVIKRDNDDSPVMTVALSSERSIRELSER
jgi:multidrug efflux pump subunit AcrA (membrane-fusion protein)